MTKNPGVNCRGFLYLKLSMRTLGKNSDGFSIVEMLIAIAISAAFIGSVSAMLTNNARLAQRSRDVAVANSYAENKVEELRSIGYLGLNIGTTSITSELPNELRPPRNGSLVISNDTTSVKKAVISITYSDQGKPKTYYYTTKIGELGVGQY